MRTFEEIKSDVDQAMSNNDAQNLQRLSEELKGIHTSEAHALLHNALGSAFRLSGDNRSAMEQYQRALSEYQALGDVYSSAGIISNIGSVHFSNGEFAQALQHYELARASYITLDDKRKIASMTYNVGAVYESIGEHALALYDLMSALEQAREHGNDQVVAAAHGAIGNVLRAQGNHAEALANHQQALVLHEKRGDRWSVAQAIGNIGAIQVMTGEFADALESFHHALAIFTDLAALPEVARVTGNIGEVYWSMDDYPSALLHLGSAMELHQQCGNRLGEAMVTGGLGRTHASMTDYDRALEYYESALALHRELGDRSGVARVTGHMGSVYRNRGDLVTASTIYENVLRMHEELQETNGRVNATLNLCELAIIEEAYERAQQLLESISEAHLSHPDQRAVQYAHRASIAEHRGDLDTACSLLSSSLEIATAAQLRERAARVHERLRDLARKRNDLPEYITHNDEYLRITNEVRGQKATKKIAMIEAEKRIAAERAEKEKHRALLYNTLPPAIADRVLRGETVNDSHDMAAVMFMDMVGFTTMSSAMEAGEVVKLLSEIFTTCDAIMAEHGMMKIKTIGDSYMAIAISNTEDPKPKTTQTVNSAVNNAAHAAVKVLTTLSELHPQIKVRIGLHCGPVTAGVIGTERLQYDVWGDTVNVASRMESHGEPGRIHVSEAFASRLRGNDDSNRHPREGGDPHRPLASAGVTSNVPDSLTLDSLTLIKRGEVSIKGKGPMTTYWLEGA